MNWNRRSTVVTVMLASLASVSAGAALVQNETPASAIRPAAEGTRGPFEVAFTPDGKRAVVTELDEGSVAVIDADDGRVLQRIPTGGQQPTGVAITPDGKLALVTNSYGESLAFIDLTQQKATTIPLRGMPYDVVISPDGRTAYVSVSQLDQVAVVDIASRQVVARLETGRRPRALSLTPDGTVLATANLTQGSVTFLDVVNRRVIGQGPTPAVNLRGVAIYPNGRQAYAIGQRALNERPTETSIGIWANQAFRVVPNGGPNGAENIWLDLIGKDVADPESVLFDPELQFAYVTHSGGHSLNVFPLRGNGDVKTVRGVGAVPKGLALRPGSREIWVANHLGNDLAVVSLDSLEVTRRVALEKPSRPTPHVEGRFLFQSATLTYGQQFSCNSCHPDGNTDGITWKFVHVPDALGKEVGRNVRSLRGPIDETAPFRWTGHAATLADFVQDEVTGLLKSPKLEEPQLQAMVGFLRSLKLPPNPYRNPDGTLTEAALRGKALFTGKADCISCHTGPNAGGQRKAWIGTTPEGAALDVPHLTGVYDSYPYLHDGRAATLEEIFSKHNATKLHGRAHLLSTDEMRDLLEYVRQQ